MRVFLRTRLTHFKFTYWRRVTHACISKIHVVQHWLRDVLSPVWQSMTGSVNDYLNQCCLIICWNLRDISALKLQSKLNNCYTRKLKLSTAKCCPFCFSLGVFKHLLIFTTKKSSKLFSSGSIGQSVICLDWRALSMYEMGTRINMYQPLFLFWGQPNQTRYTSQSAVCNLSFCEFRIRQRLNIRARDY